MIITCKEAGEAAASDVDILSMFGAAVLNFLAKTAAVDVLVLGRRSRVRQHAEMRQHFKIFAVRQKFGSAPAVGQLKKKEQFYMMVWQGLVEGQKNNTLQILVEWNGTAAHLKNGCAAVPTSEIPRRQSFCSHLGNIAN